MSEIITRFAPSPTGFLHIGGARTALYNWLYAKANNGKFLLRIEDTDVKRSTKEAIDVIINGLNWLGLERDDVDIYQSHNIKRHQEIVQALLENGQAYKCYHSKEELEQARENNLTNEEYNDFIRYWRDKGESHAPSGINPVIRIKSPISGEITIADKVQATVSISHNELDDFIILRADGTPTYLLAVVVDDHDMQITDIIRGDDHFTNSFRQKIIYDALGWEFPNQIHIPLIHGSDGAKLSKRHGALGIDYYQEQGYLPEAIRNYLLRLGWSHGDDEIISTEQAIKWFNLENIGKSPARLDIKKLQHVNNHYLDNLNIQELSDQLIFELVTKNENLQSKLLPSNIIDNEADNENSEIKLLLTEYLANQQDKIYHIINNARNNGANIKIIASLVGYAFYNNDLVKSIFKLDDKAQEKFDEGKYLIEPIINLFAKIGNKDWRKDAILAVLKEFLSEQNLKPKNVFPVIRMSLTFSLGGDDLFTLVENIGKDKTIDSLKFHV